jgi:hypothetical protein
MQRLGKLKDKKMFKSPTFREVRESATVIYKRIEADMYDGVSREQYIDGNVRKLLHSARLARMKQLDKVGVSVCMCVCVYVGMSVCLCMCMCV